MNQIHPTVIIEGDVELGAGNKILPYCVLIGPLKIGDNNLIGPHVVIGSPGQDTRNPYYDSSNCPVRIGNGNIIREFSAIQKPCYDTITEFHNDIHIMQSVHIPHDAILEDKVVVTPMVAMGGLVRLLEGANIGIGANLHQRIIIGQYSIVGMGASVLKNVKPFSRLVPGKSISVNEYAIKKFGFEDVQDEISRYVLESKMPVTDRVLAIIDKYTALHRESKREQY